MGAEIPTKMEHGREVVDGAALEASGLRVLVHAEVGGRVWETYEVSPADLDREPISRIDVLAPSALRRAHRPEGLDVGSDGRRVLPTYPATGGTMSVVIAVDLGKWRCGRAIAVDGVVVDCQTISIPRARVHDPSHMADRLVHAPPDMWLGAETVCEWPQKYTDARIKHADLEDLHAVGDCLRWHKKYRPAAWKGNVPKPVFARRIRKVLTPAELRVIPWDEHDAVDALGILLFHIGRIKRGGTKP